MTNDWWLNIIKSVLEIFHILYQIYTLPRFLTTFPKRKIREIF